MFTLDTEQSQAIKAARDWLQRRLIDPKVQQVFRIGGPAGSGKTTIIREITAAFPDLVIAITTLSGKAAEVLRSKGIDKAAHLHSIFYLPFPEVLARQTELELLLHATDDYAERARLRKEIATLKQGSFIQRDKVPYDLIIVDEASMIGPAHFEDLKRYGLPILAVGDPNQLPPVDSVGSPWLQPLFADQVPDVTLVTNHRSAEAPLVALAADAARSGDPFPLDVLVDLHTVDLTSYDVILVGRNASRWPLVKRIREAQGKPVKELMVGDTILVVKNNRKHDVFNGTVLTVDAIEHVAVPNTVHVISDGMRYPVDTRGFRDEKNLNEAKANSVSVVATFADVMTVHKAQGSEYERVLIAEGPSNKTPRADLSRWWYTAVTRARSVVHIAA